MCFEYDDICDVHESRIVKTRKLHTCSGCRRAIAINAKAFCNSGLFDGAWFRYYVCDRCTRLQYSIAIKEILEGCDWSMAWIHAEDLSDYLDELRSYDEDIKPLGMPTLDHCRRYLDDLWLMRTGYARPDETTRLELLGITE